MRNYISDLLTDVRRDAIAKFDATKDVLCAFNAVSTIVHMSNVGRQEGLLALEEVFVYEPSPEDALVSSMVLLVVDGTDPDIVAEVLTNEYWANKYEGNEALAQYILMRGTLLVQEGANPYCIEFMLKSLFPKALHEKFAKHLENKKSIWSEEENAKTMERFKKWEPVELADENIKKRVHEVEELVLTLDDRALQRVMRDVTNHDVTHCAAVFSEKGRNFIFKNVSNRLLLMMMKDLISISGSIAWYGESSFLSAVEKLEEVIQLLESSGEIILLK